MKLHTMTYRVDSGVAHIRFTRPEGANAMNSEFATDLREVMIAASFDDAVKAVSVTAEGKVFCAGGDLKYFNTLGDALPQTAASLVTDYHAATYRMNRMPKPVVAGVRGAAGGAGMSLMCAMDLVIAGESAKFTMGYTKAAMTPDGTSSYFLARHIGLRRAMELTLTNRVLSAQEALDWGLVNTVVPDDEVDEAAAELAGSLAAGPARSLGAAKRLIYEGYESELEVAGEREAHAITATMATPDGIEGIAAFAERRPPIYRSTWSN
jgi:2-(1,2-epoxy-1,2-dihydrophenyl)acetyl-CoA isomerase